MKNLEFVIAKKEDIQKIYDVFVNAIKDMKQKGIEQWDDIYPNINVIKNDIDMSQMYLGICNSDIASAFVLNMEFDEEYKLGMWKYPNAAFMIVHRLCVNPIYQNQGIATMTMLYIENTLREQGIETIRLDSFTRNPSALRLYTKLGFHKVGYANWRKGKFYLLEKKL